MIRRSQALRPGANFSRSAQGVLVTVVLLFGTSTVLITPTVAGASTGFTPTAYLLTNI
jgi:hypothetical protein